MMVILFLAMMFVSSIQPMIMVMMLIFIVILYSYIIYIMVGSYWFSYVLVMVMLSGVLIVFTYMVSLIPNESFESFNLLYVLMFIVIMMGNYYYWIYIDKLSLISLKLWSSYISVFNLFMVSFLLMIMLLVVWLSYINKGAMRVL